MAAFSAGVSFFWYFCVFKKKKRAEKLCLELLESLKIKIQQLFKRISL